MGKRKTRLKADPRTKLRDIRLLKRKPPRDAAAEARAGGLVTGSVWMVADRSVPFDTLRLEEHYKEQRPCLVLQTPLRFGSSDLVEIAPGTTTPHTIFNKTKPTLLAGVPPEDLKRTTWFLLYLSWDAVQKTLIRKRTELSPRLRALAERKRP